MRSQVEACARGALEACLGDLQVIASSPAGAAPDVSAIYPLLQHGESGYHSAIGDGLRGGSTGGTWRGRGAAGGDYSGGGEGGLDWAPLGWYEADAQVDSITARAVGSWRAQFAQAVQRKVHSLFLLTLMDDLPSQLMRCMLTAQQDETIGAADLTNAREVRRAPARRALRTTTLDGVCPSAVTPSWGWSSRLHFPPQYPLHPLSTTDFRLISCDRLPYLSAGADGAARAACEGARADARPAPVLPPDQGTLRLRQRPPADQQNRCSLNPLWRVGPRRPFIIHAVAHSPCRCKCDADLMCTALLAAPPLSRLRPVMQEPGR